MPPPHNVTWTVGDSNDMLIDIVDPGTGLPMSLGTEEQPGVVAPGVKLWLLAKQLLSDPDSAAVVAISTDTDATDPTGGITITDALLGRAIASIPASAFATMRAPAWLYYAVQLRDANGKVWEVVRGVATVQPGLVSAQ
jgi:hypothetical protein